MSLRAAALADGGAVAARTSDPTLTPIAGCTDVYVGLHFGTLPQTRFLDLWRLDELRGISVDGDVLRIGALTTYTEIIQSPLVQQRAADAGRGGARGRRRADPESRHARRQHRQRVAGRRHAAGAGGGRRARSCCAAPAATRRGAVRRRSTPAIARRVRAARRADRRRSRSRAIDGAQWFRKVGTRARAGDLEGRDGRRRAATAPRIALGSVAPTVVRAAEDRSGAGRGRLDRRGAAASCCAEIAPIDDIRSTAEYRRRVAANLLARVLGAVRTPARRGRGRDAADARLPFAAASCCRTASVRRRIHVARRRRSPRVAGYDDVPAGRDAGRRRAIWSISPGLVDTHVHVNEPGRTEWEGFDTATRAAAAGGVTTIVDMPLNSIPATTTSPALRGEARGGARPRVMSTSASGAASCRATPRDLEPLVDAGVRGFKCFLAPSGVDEFPACDEADLRAGAAGPGARRHGAAAGPRRVARPARPRRLRRCGRPAPSHRVVSRPISRPGRRRRRSKRSACWRALAAEYRRAARTSCTCRRPAAWRRSPRAQARGVPITAETCPHYLTFAAEDDARRRDGVQVRAADPQPPSIARRCGRPATRHARAWSSTDHSPAPPALKCLDERRLRRGVGRHRVAAAVARRGLDRRARRARRSAPRRSGRAG